MLFYFTDIKLYIYVHFHVFICYYYFHALATLNISFYYALYHRHSMLTIQLSHSIKSIINSFTKEILSCY